jgi:hypothetical protein
MLSLAVYEREFKRAKPRRGGLGALPVTLIETFDLGADIRTGIVSRRRFDSAERARRGSPSAADRVDQPVGTLAAARLADAVSSESCCVHLALGSAGL